METEKNKLSHAYWSARAGEYSQLHYDSYLSNDRMFYATQVALSLPLKEEVVALDLGCGSGFMSLILLDAGCAVTGVDFSREMLRQAKENVRKRGYEAKFVQMNIQELGFPDNTFDFIVSRNVTWTCENVPAIYSEVMRVLKDDGVFLNLDTNYGKIFNEAEARGEKPTHPTQTDEQLRMRNDIARDLPITQVERPQWDIDQFWRLGAGEVRCRRTQIHKCYSDPQTQLFALEVHGSHVPYAKTECAQDGEAARREHEIRSNVRKMSKAVREMREGKAIFVDYVRVGVFEFDPNRFAVEKQGVSIALTPREFNILFELARHAGELVSHDELAAVLWGCEASERAGEIPVFIRRIREKIEDDPSNPVYLLTKWRKGYLFNPGETTTR